MTFNEFIDRTIVGELGRIIEDGYYYHSFILMACAIEFLGALLDKDRDIHATGRSKKRFKEALKYFPSEYHGDAISGALYEIMRCGMCHAMRPTRGVLLTNRQEAIDYGTSHLQRHMGELILISEQLYEDLCGAIDQIRRLSINERKDLNKKFLRVPLNLDTTSPAASGTYLGTGCHHFPES